MPDPQYPYQPPQSGGGQPAGAVPEASGPAGPTPPQFTPPPYGAPQSYAPPPYGAPQQASGYVPPASGQSYAPPPGYPQYGSAGPTPFGQSEPGAPGSHGTLQQPPGYVPAPVGVTAGAGLRLVGYLIDAFLLSIVNGVVNNMFPGPVSYVGDLAVKGQGGFATFLITVIALCYFAYLNGRGQTIGKRIMRTKVVDADTGAPIGTSRAAIRWLVSVLMSIPLMLGWLSVPLNSETRGFHDRAANDRVVRV